MNNYTVQIDAVKNYFLSTAKERAKFARRVKARIKGFPLESRQHAAKATLKLINEHDWNLAEGEFLSGGLLNKIAEHIIWSKSIETK